MGVVDRSCSLSEFVIFLRQWMKVASWPSVVELLRCMLVRAKCDCRPLPRPCLPDQGSGLPWPHSGFGTHHGAWPTFSPVLISTSAGGGVNVLRSLWPSNSAVSKSKKITEFSLQKSNGRRQHTHCQFQSHLPRADGGISKSYTVPTFPAHCCCLGVGEVPCRAFK